MNKTEIFEIVNKAITEKYDVMAKELDLKQNIMSFRINDKYVTDELYEYGVYITHTLIKEMQEVVNVISEENDLDEQKMSLSVEHCDKCWVDVTLNIL